jgi:plastocyanin
MKQLLLVAAVALAAPAAPRGTAPDRNHVIVMDNLRFGPVPTDLRVGDTIIWRNQDMFRHSATARNGSFDVDLPARKTGSTKLTKPGTVIFYCRYHPGMTGRLNVRN